MEKAGFSLHPNVIFKRQIAMISLNKYQRSMFKVEMRCCCAFNRFTVSEQFAINEYCAFMPNDCLWCTVDKLWLFTIWCFYCNMLQMVVRVHLLSPLIFVNVIIKHRHFKIRVLFVLIVLIINKFCLFIIKSPTLFYINVGGYYCMHTHTYTHTVYNWEQFEAEIFQNF